MRLLARPVVWVTGPTSYDNPSQVRDAMAEHLTAAGGLVLQGGAAGVDATARIVAPTLSAFTVTVPYYGPGRAAGGPMRNEVLAELAAALRDSGQDVRVLAIGHSSGTENSVGLARSFGLDVREYDR